jgi:hypothetical protein
MMENGMKCNTQVRPAHIVQPKEQKINKHSATLAKNEVYGFLKMS